MKYAQSLSKLNFFACHFVIVISSPSANC